MLHFIVCHRHCHKVDMTVKVDTMKLLIQGQCLLWCVLKCLSMYSHDGIPVPASAHYSAEVLIRISLRSLLVVSGLSVSLPSLLLNASLSAPDRKEQLNAVKMSVFLLCKLTEILESDSYRQSIITAPSKVGPSAPSHI